MSSIFSLSVRSSREEPVLAELPAEPGGAEEDETRDDWRGHGPQESPVERPEVPGGVRAPPGIES
jgi:hypothetical protein